MPKKVFTKKMNEIFLPKFKVAKNMGFESDWTLN